MPSLRTLAMLVLLLGMAWPLLADPPPAAADGREAAVDFFERKVRPLLARRCYSCHSARSKSPKGELKLDSAAALAAGGSRGPVVVPGQPEQSLLVRAVRRQDEQLRMPPAAGLPDDEIEILVQWVRGGALFPSAADAPAAAAGHEFWSFQPPRRYAPPPVERGAWAQRTIDAFVLARLEQQGLAPSPPADRRTLIRRAMFDLVGLPPSAAQVEAFVAEPSPLAYEQLVDRLLASPHYGERWGRFWLDLARYTDTTASWLKSTGDAWRYRDWVVRALNDDLAYDDFVTRQLAADLLDDADPADLAALGFLGLSPTYWKELRLAPDVIRVVVAEEWDERVDALSRSFLGLTVACARCHDHKFDPVTMEDYYALAGVVASTTLADRPLLPAPQAEAVLDARRRVEALQAQIEKIKSGQPEQAAALEKEIAAIKQATPHYDAPDVNAVQDGTVFVVPDGPDLTRLDYRPGEVRDLPIFLRGNPQEHGAVVPRRFLKVLSPDQPPPALNHGSGRLDLARAIFREGRPLSSRVIVNRVWREYFGRGLVATPSNFGAQGQPPSHPQLLDDLAARFVEQGWSLKWLHREILLSATYRQASDYDAAREKLDPDNRWLWRMNRRRLSIEAWRDAMLAVAGDLDLGLGGPPQELEDAAHHRRTLYGTIHRRDLSRLLRLYDFPEPTSHSPGRELTTTPLQQLFALNGPLIRRQAAALAARVQADDSLSRRQQVQLCYRLALAREASQREVQLAEQFLAATGADGWPQYTQVLLSLNEFMFVD